MKVVEKSGTVGIVTPLTWIKPVISVVIPIYNVKPYLAACVDSVLAQTYRDLEIILVDDGSTDGCGEICDAYVTRDTRIRVIHKENGGLVSARKAGLRAASADPVCYVDGDDLIEPDMIDYLLSEMRRSNADVVMCGHFEDTETASVVVHHGVAEGIYTRPILEKTIFPHMIENGEFFTRGINPSMWGKLIKKALLLPFLMAVNDRVTMGEDAVCMFPLLLNANTVCVTDRPLYHYRQNNESMSRQLTESDALRERFRLLYRAGMEALSACTHIFDCRAQWTDYVLFLMLARADVLYRGIEDLDYLFPFPDVKKGAEIIIYGASIYGRRLYHFMKRTGFCRVKAIADRNAAVLRDDDFPVVIPEDLTVNQGDIIVIAVTYYNTQHAILSDLKSRFPEARVYAPDPDVIRSKEAMRAFGLN